MGGILIKQWKGSTDKRVSISLGGRIAGEFAHLQHWSLEDIRVLYDKFLSLCKGKQYKYISKRVLFYLLQMKESYIIELFDNFDYENQNRINIYELLVSMIWTAHANKDAKLKFAFSIFDFDRNEGFMEPEMLAVFMNTCMGVSRLTRNYIPDHDTLLLIARKAFEMSDVNNDGCIEYIDVVNWAEARPEFVKFLAKYEPQNKVDVKEEINHGFPKYTIDGFTEEVLYLTVDFDAIRKRTFIPTNENSNYHIHDATELLVQNPNRTRHH